MRAEQRAMAASNFEDMHCDATLQQRYIPPRQAEFDCFGKEEALDLGKDGVISC